MKTAYLLIASLFTASLALGGCGVDRVDPIEEDADQGYYFTGFVYDGVNGATLTDYTVTLTYDAAIDEFSGGAGAGGDVTRTLTAQVTDGRYRVGPLKPHSDFTIEIEADGYRAFVSHNPMFEYLPGNADQQSTELYEAYLFPTSVESPAVTFELFSETDGVDRPTGSIRVTPIDGEADSDLSLTGTLGSSVNNQLWINDNDARNATVVKEFEEGELSFDAGELVYGVTYVGTFFGVEGHQYENIVFTAGLSGSQTVILGELTDADLVLVSSSLDGSAPNDEGRVVYTFNRPIEFSPEYSEEYIAELIDDNFFIDSPDADIDADYNELTFTDEPEDQETGTKIEIDGNRLILTWANASSNFETEDADDPILSVTYSALYSVSIRGVGDVDVSSLGNFVGSDSVTVLLAPVAP